MVCPTVALGIRHRISRARRRAAGWATPFALLVGCGSNHGQIPDDEPPVERTGSLELALVAPPEVQVLGVEYIVSDSSGEKVVKRKAEVEGDTFEFLLRLPAATGYELELTADGVYEGETIPCEGSVRFNVEPRELTRVALEVVCTARGRVLRSVGTGGAQVTAHVSVEEDHACAVESLTVGPLVVYEGREISVLAVVEPADAALVWSTAGELEGDFQLDETGTRGEFLCRRGQGELVVEVESRECTDRASVPVTCATPSVCGDGALELGEDCDDGNLVAEDGCSPTCRIEGCGDGIVQRGESCDDGNRVAGDGCGATCSAESCGNGLLEGAEQCDDGNLTTGDGCTNTCEIESCGDGVVQRALGEECDDGDRNGRDGCSRSCRFEDEDEDGVVDRLDDCPDTKDAPVDLEGCSLEQRCPCSDDWASKAQYLSCSAKVLDRLFAAEIIDAEARAAWETELSDNACGETP